MLDILSELEARALPVGALEIDAGWRACRNGIADAPGVTACQGAGSREIGGCVRIALLVEADETAVEAGVRRFGCDPDRVLKQGLRLGSAPQSPGIEGCAAQRTNVIRFDFERLGECLVCLLGTGHFVADIAQQVQGIEILSVAG